MIFFVLPALAFDLEEGPSRTLAGPADTLVMLAVPGGTRVAALSGDAVQLLDPLDPSWSVTIPGEAVALATREGDSRLWECAEDGLWSAEWAPPAAPDPFVQVSAPPCDALVSVGQALVEVTEQSVLRLEDDGAGGLTSTAMDLVIEGAPLLAASGDAVLVAGLGETSVHLVDADGVTTYEAAGPVSGVGWWQGVPLWTTSSPAELSAADGESDAVYANPGALAEGDLDGDGLTDIAVLHGPDGVIGAFLGGAGPELARFAGRPLASFVVVQGAGPCADVWTVSGDATLSTWSDATCPVACDDDIPAWLPEEVAVLEGEEVSLPAFPQCFDGADMTVTLTGDDWVHCDDSPYLPYLTCWGPDDGFALLDVAVRDRDGAWADEREMTVTVLNAAPVLIPPGYSGGCGCSNEPGAFEAPEFEVHVGRDVSATFDVYDRGLDWHHWGVAGGPPNLSIDDAGEVHWSVKPKDLGTWSAKVVVTDDDGGSDETVFTIHVRRAWPCGCIGGGGSGGSAGSAAALLVFALARRGGSGRRRGVGQQRA